MLFADQNNQYSAVFLFSVWVTYVAIIRPLQVKSNLFYYRKSKSSITLFRIFRIASYYISDLRYFVFFSWMCLLTLIIYSARILEEFHLIRLAALHLKVSLRRVLVSQTIPNATGCTVCYLYFFYPSETGRWFHFAIRFITHN